MSILLAYTIVLFLIHGLELNKYSLPAYTLAHLARLLRCNVEFYIITIEFAITKFNRPLNSTLLHHGIIYSTSLLYL